MLDELHIAWRLPVTDEELVALTEAHGGRAEQGWWNRVQRHSLGWVTARERDGTLVSFVNVAWDGGDHAFLLDTKTLPSHQRRGVGTSVVRRAIVEARLAGCSWLHVDYEPELTQFYLDACGFRSTAAGLVMLQGEEE